MVEIISAGPDGNLFINATNLQKRIGEVAGDLGKSLTPEQLNVLFPQFHRYFGHTDIENDRYTFHPQPGEYYRYGVYFSGISDEFPVHTKVNANNILLSTHDLFSSCGIQEELLAKGILINPSPAYETQVTQARAMHKGRDYLDIYGSVEKRFITLDLGVARQNRSPILSIPHTIYVPKNYLLSPQLVA